MHQRFYHVIILLALTLPCSLHAETISTIELPGKVTKENERSILDKIKDWFVSEDEKDRANYHKKFSPQDQKTINKQLDETDLMLRSLE